MVSKKAANKNKHCLLPEIHFEETKYSRVFKAIM